MSTLLPRGTHSYGQPLLRCDLQVSRGCRCCADRRGNRRDFRQGGVEIDDFDEEVRYHKANSGGYSKRKRVCKKSKNNELCDFTVPLITRQYYSSYTKKWHYTKVMTCSRCGKHGQWLFGESRWRL